MYRVYFEESFFEWLDTFLTSMKNYYRYFYSNTWIYDEDKIVEWYFDLFDNLKTDILNKINEVSLNWILWRKIIYSKDKIENCSFIFSLKIYKRWL